jgi:DNA-binding beta-propeller fold protein YncE
MVVDSEGNMYVACYSDNAIVKIDKNNNRTNFVKDYLLDGPIGLAIDTYDNIYVANFDANNILKITKSGNVSVFMTNVSKPYFLYIKNDVLFVSEQGNDVVLSYQL